MRAGLLRDRITLQTKATGHDAAGGLVAASVQGVTLWARAIPKGAREFERFDRLEGETSIVFQIRHRAGVDEKQRVVWGGRTFDVTGYENPDARGREGLIYCREVR